MEDYLYKAKNGYEFTYKEIKEMKEKDLVVYKGGFYGIKIIPREKFGPLFKVLCFNDGEVYSCTFDEFAECWAKDIVDVIKEAKKYWKKIRKNYE